tara:strand:+ start:213 stop:599 length:387 start_codon:yes stop_codon:yes gene_type:complete
MAIIRKTKSLEMVLQVFEKSDRAMSALELFNSLKSEMNKSTVYRLLDRLETEGVIHSILGNDGLKWYAKCRGCSSDNHNDVHPHFQCRICNQVDCLDLKIALPNVPKRIVEGAHFMTFGICETCIIKD